MSKAKEIFKMDENDRWIGIFLSFQPIIDSFGEVLLQCDRYDDAWILYRFDNNEYGCLRLDKIWDLQADHNMLCACQTYEEVDAYIDELEQNLYRWPDAYSALSWFSDYDWANDDRENKSFCIQAIKILQQEMSKMKGEEKMHALSSFEREAFRIGLTAVQTEIHRNAVSKGFYEGETNIAEKIALMHSELSEALEALRNGNPPDDKIPEFSGLEAELADVVIRIADTAEYLKFNLAKAILAKMEYNYNRPHKHGKKF